MSASIKLLQSVQGGNKGGGIPTSSGSSSIQLLNSVRTGTYKPSQVIPVKSVKVNNINVSEKTNKQPQGNIFTGIINATREAIDSFFNKPGPRGTMSLSEQYSTAMKHLSLGVAPSLNYQQEKISMTSQDIAKQKKLDQVRVQKQQEALLKNPVTRFGNDVRTVLLSTLQGATGGLFKNPIKDLSPEDHIIKPISEIGGAIFTLTKLQNGIGGLLGKTPIATIAKNNPKLKFMIPLFKNVGSFSIYDQLDPDVKDRMKALAISAEQGLLFTSLGVISKARYSVPLAFGGGFGLAKFNGASNEDAVQSGIIFAALEGANKIPGLFGSKFKSGKREFTPQEARDFVVGSEFEKTKLGKDIIKASFQAQTAGKNIQVDLGAAKKKVASKLFKTQSPEGIGYKINLIDPKTPPQGKIGQGETSVVDPTGQGVPDVIKKELIKNTKIRIPTEFRGPQEKAIFDKLQNEPESITRDYIEKFENEVSPDKAISILEGYEGHNVTTFSRAGAAIKTLVYDQALETQKGQKNNTVYITAGGPGSGKTSSLTGEENVKAENAVVVDTTFSGKSAPKDIEKALDNGYKVKISFVLRDPGEAWERGVIPRIKEEGRIVTEGYFVDATINAQKNIINTYDRYKNNSDVEFEFIDNRGKEAKAIDIDTLKSIDYNSEKVSGFITRVTEDAYAKKQITEKEYKSIIETYG